MTRFYSEPRPLFIEYAFKQGIYAAGAADVQRAAPKLLLVEDLEGRWHAEGVLPDDQVAKSWIVKRPRGNAGAADRKVLRNEAAFMEVARRMGLQVFAPLTWESDSLFVPRFDRRVAHTAPIQRLGMESLYSLAGIADCGVAVTHDHLLKALMKYSSEPGQDLLEYIKRDILNVVMGNKDNHGRNTAVLKYESGRVQLSPLFDFAPMYLDPEGIARVCRWDGDAETAGVPHWETIVERYSIQLGEGRGLLRAFGRTLLTLPEVAREVCVDDDIIESRVRAIEEHAKQLMALQGQ